MTERQQDDAPAHIYVTERNEPLIDLDRSQVVVERTAPLETQDDDRIVVFQS